MNQEGVFSMKTNRIIYSAAFVILSLVLLHASAAFAEIKPGSINLTTSLGGYKVDSGLHYDNGLDWGLGAGLNFSEKLGAEFNFNSVDSESGGNSGKILLYRLDLLYHIRRLPSGKTIPYVSCGTGFASYKNKGVGNRKEYNFILDPGFGVKHYISKNFALRGDARYIIDVNGDSLYHSFLLNAGLLFEFSLDEEEPIPPPPVEPAAEPVREEICPQGPEGCTQKDWCKTDSDGDGVPDCLDKCPDTPVGVKVDAQGCPPAEEQGVIIFRNILFDFARSNIRPESPCRPG
jgi:OOP family OmpA-OmpF porin